MQPLDAKIKQVYSSANWFRSCTSIYSQLDFYVKLIVQVADADADALELSLWFSSRNKFQMISSELPDD